MNQRHRAVVACAGIVGLFLVVQLGALAVAEPFVSAGFQPDVDHGDPTNSLIYVGAILVATVLMLAAFRLDVDGMLRGLLVFAAAYVAVFLFRVLVPPLVVVEGLHVLAWAGGLLLGVALWVHPEWYVIDVAGVIMGIGAGGLLGITLGILPALVLLVVLAVYDAISVYGTEHMLTLASGVMELRVPIVFVVPLTLSYSFLDADLPDPDEEGDGEEDDDEEDDDEEGAAAGGETEAEAKGEATADGDDGATEGAEADLEASPLDREAMFIGLGDAVIPTILVASAGFFAPASVPSLGVPGLALTLPAATAVLGTTVGLVVLLWLVLQGRAHAGLPLLNGGAILGYLAGALASGMSLAAAVGLSG